MGRRVDAGTRLLENRTSWDAVVYMRERTFRPIIDRHNARPDPKDDALIRKMQEMLDADAAAREPKAIAAAGIKRAKEDEHALDLNRAGLSWDDSDLVP